MPCNRKCSRSCVCSLYKIFLFVLFIVTTIMLSTYVDYVNRWQPILGWCYAVAPVDAVGAKRHEAGAHYCLGPLRQPGGEEIGPTIGFAAACACASAHVTLL
jgi:hypothetical protein